MNDACPKCRRILDADKIKDMDGDVATCKGCGATLLIGDWPRISAALDALVEAGVPAAHELRAELDKQGVPRPGKLSGSKVVIAVDDLGLVQ